MQFEPIATGFKFLEAGRAKSDGSLFFSDYDRGGVHRLSSTGTLDRWATDLRSIGGLVENDDGRLLLTSAEGIWLLDPVSGDRVALPVAVNGARSFNDVESDGVGGFFVGTIDLAARIQQRRPDYGELLHVDSHGHVHVLVRDIGAANGIGIDAARELLYLSDTGTGVWRFSISPSGELSDRQLISTLTDSDGLTVDASGAIWVAGWQSGTINRISPDASETSSFRVPSGQAMTLAFGGDEFGDLYVFGGSDVTNPSSAPDASIYLARGAGQGVPAPPTSVRFPITPDPTQSGLHQTL